MPDRTMIRKPTFSHCRPAPDKALSFSARRLVLTCVLASVGLSACAPFVPVVLAGAATGGVLVATDRRSSGAQLDDQTIEVQGASAMRSSLPGNANVHVKSYNRKVLLVGEVPRQIDKDAAERAMKSIPTVEAVANELDISHPSGLAQSTSDSWITAQVKAKYVNSRELSVSAIQTLTDKGVVYLMGRLTLGEGRRAAELASAVSGVKKVVALFETISVTERDQILRVAPKPDSTANATVPATPR